MKSRPSAITFRDNYSNYNSSGSYVPRKVKAHRRLLAKQNSVSDTEFHDLEILKRLESIHHCCNREIPVKSQPELSHIENVT
jgi:hypothetical protein